MASDPIVRKQIRVPPQNIEAEKAFLGSIMLRPEAMNEIIDIISPAVFYAAKHAVIFKTMLGLFGKNQPIDLLSVSSRLKETNELDQIGGMSYLTEIVGTVPSASNVRHYAELIQKKYLLRRLIDTSDKISELGYEEAADIEAV